MVAAMASDFQLLNLADNLRKADADEESDDASTKAPTTCSSSTSRAEDVPSPGSASSRTDELSVAAKLCAVWEADQESRQSAAAAAVRDIPAGHVPPRDNLGVYVQRGPILDFDVAALEEAPALDTPGCALIVWDWDDTLCPTSWLCTQGLALNGASPSKAQLDTFRTVDDQVSSTMEMAKTKGTNVIITNAERGWVQLAARAWMPKLAAAIRGVRIVSARTEYESVSCQHPIAWKARAFEEVTKAHFERHGTSVQTLISFGDSAAERQAALQVWPSLVSEKSSASQVYMKSVKLPERPTVATMNSSHTMLVSMLTTLVDHAGHLDLVVAIREPSPDDPDDAERCIEV